LPDTFEDKEGEYPLTNPDELKLNHDQSGFYRVAYNPEFIPSLTKRLTGNKFDPLDRLGLLADTFEAAKAGYTDTRSALQLMEAYRTEDNNAVWDVMTLNLGAIRAIMDDEAIREGMKPYAQELSAMQLLRLGWEVKAGELYFDSLLRPTILALNAASDEPGVLEEILARFNAMKRSEDIEPDLRGIVYTTAARKGDAKTFEKLLKLYDGTKNSEERVTLAAALTNFEQPKLIEKALGMITTDRVRLQDVTYWVVYSLSNRHARATTWKWIQKHWDWLEKNLGNDLSFSRMPLYAARAGTGEEFLKEYKAFFEKVSQPSLERSIRQGTETIEWQSEWRRRDLEAIRDFFTK
jgi:aminopeptidase 2